MRKPEFVYVTYVETTPEKLWEALTSSAFTKRYWFNTEVKSDWKVGSPFALVTNGTTTDVGEVLEFDRPQRLSYTFHHILDEAAKKERPSRVTFVLEPAGKLVKLTLTHEDFAEDSVVLGGISSGWPAILSSLKSLLESGTALEIPPPCGGIQ
jgi:uncharacterized protein YndB with AHSA1/START domain